MYVKEINEVKDNLEQLKTKGLIQEWELPYENLLTRLSAAIFFITPAGDDESSLGEVWSALEQYANFSFRLNHEKKLSGLQYRITFSEEEKQKNLQQSLAVNHV
jgi:hypothetical protein